MQAHSKVRTLIREGTAFFLSNVAVTLLATLQVFLRIRPPTQSEGPVESVFEVDDDRTVTITAPEVRRALIRFPRFGVRLLEKSCPLTEMILTVQSLN